MTEESSAGSIVSIKACHHTLGSGDGGAAVVFRLDQFDLAAGETAALTGPSGCGKSTFLNIVSGLIRPDEGKVSVNGVEVTRLSHSAMDRFRGLNLGFIFQTFNLLPSFTALENVMVGMRFGRGIPVGERRARAEELLARVRLSHRAHAKPEKLSVGERQRVAIARAVANRPPLLLADEPTGSLDPTTGEEVFHLLLEICREENCAMLFVTHDLDLAARLGRQFDCRGLVTHGTVKVAS